MNLIKYRMTCTVDGFVYSDWIEEGDPVPDQCPIDSGHTLVAGETIEVAQVSDVYAVDTEKHIEVSENAPIGEELYAFSWNFCDQSAWPEDAVLVSDFEMRDKEVAGNREWDTRPTAPEDPLHTYWIDIQHGRLPFEHELTLDYNPLTNEDIGIKAAWADYIPVVKLLPNGQADLPENWVAKTEDVDFYINYNAGELVFLADLTAGDRVKATFRKSCGIYKYTFIPPTGKKVRITYAEAHGSSDFKMTGWIRRTVWVYNPLDLPNKAVYERKTYKTYRDLILDSTGAFPVIPASGGSYKIGQYVYRGLHDQDMIQVPFRFLAVNPLKYSIGGEYVVTLEQAWEGTFANVVLYCRQEDE